MHLAKRKRKECGLFLFTVGKARDMGAQRASRNGGMVCAVDANRAIDRVRVCSVCLAGYRPENSGTKEAMGTIAAITRGKTRRIVAL